MSEKKKLSTAEILAMARKGTAASPSGSVPAAESPTETPATEPKPAESKAADAPKAADKPAAEKPAKPAAGGARPSVAEILAAARAKGAAGPAADKPAEPAAEKPKLAPKPKPEAKPKVEAAEESTTGGPKDTASILAAARKGAKPGPMSKEEAARQADAGKAAAKAPAEKPAAKAKPSAPPMPAKPSSVKPKAAKGADEEDRRGFIGFMLGTFLGLGFTSLAATFSLWGLGTARFMFPNVLTEPPSQFKVGFPADFPPGSVADKFKAQFGVWVVNYEYNGVQEIYALRTVCTHLGCTPNWLEGEQKFKCPCHGSGFYKDGINFEGPAPRPLERYAIRLADDGQLEVDKSKLFMEEKGEWTDPACYVPV